MSTFQTITVAASASMPGADGTVAVVRQQHPRAGELTDELARGAKALVLHFAGLADAR